MTAATDEVLMRSYQQGNLQALETLFARHARAVYTFFLDKPKRHCRRASQSAGLAGSTQAASQL